MTFGTETAAVLRHGLDTLLHLTSPAPYALLTSEERRTALHHLMVTAEATAKLADATRAHSLVLPTGTCCDTEPIWAETERLKAEMERLRVETEKLKVEIERVESKTECKGQGVGWVANRTEQPKPEQGTVRAEALMPVEKTELLREEVERFKMDTERADEKAECKGQVAGKTVEETEQLKAEEEKVIAEALMPVQGTEMLTADTQKLKVNTESAGRKLQCKGQEVGTAEEIEQVRAEKRKEKVGAEAVMAVQGTERLKAEPEKVGKERGNVGERFVVVETGRLRVDMEKLRNEVNRLIREKERAEAEVERLGKDLERSVLVTDRLRVEMDRVRSEKAKIEAVTEWVKAELESLRERKAAVLTFGGDTMFVNWEVWVAEKMDKKLVLETEILKGEGERSAVNFETSVVETGRLRAELGRVQSETVTTEEDIEALRVELHSVMGEMMIIKARTESKRADTSMEMSMGEPERLYGC
ncbi:hypothetical protein DFP73DRAFT_567239 [Morchella snyderi]|nr:hypothetical protein DFP73DRAFT_567239 [Morchella snyderi]